MIELGRVYTPGFGVVVDLILLAQALPDLRTNRGVVRSFRVFEGTKALQRVHD